jgi:preprotein translocase subunit SecA
VPIRRIDKNDLIYRTQQEKFEAVCNRIKEVHKTGQPILVGTASIEKSELLHEMLKKYKIPHTVLNAKQHEKEGKIIEKAGLKGAVTIATNMAGRGVDIKLPQESKDLGGLLIIGTERHESRRIDNQLRGRAGRQGDVGESQFYLSLEDNLLRIFGSDKIANVMARLGLEDGEHIESSMVTRAVENAQKKVEAMHFEGRKHILEYDDVANEQRKVIYSFRDNLLNLDYDIDAKISENISEYVQNLVQKIQDVSGIVIDDFDFDKLIQKVQQELSVTIQKDQIKQCEDFDDLIKKVTKILQDTYNQKMSIAAPEQRSEIERILYLQVLDKAYRQYLYELDILKSGIRLRGYNNKDPLVEYKKESYNMFVELIESIKYDIVTTLFSVQLRDEEEERRELEQLEQLKQNMEAEVEELITQASYQEEEIKPKIGKKVPRNSPCPCGSGKKYKQCCGKSGPKKGLLA